MSGSVNQCAIMKRASNYFKTGSEYRYDHLQNSNERDLLLDVQTRKVVSRQGQSS